MSRIKNFFAGRVEFVVAGLPIACLNKLRQYQITNVKVRGEVISFTVPLVNAATVKRLVANFDWHMKENFNLFRGINFLLNHFVLSVSVLLALAAFWVLDLGIYDVKVISPDAALVEDVYAHLESIGVKKFMWKSKVEHLNLAADLVDVFPNVAHAHVRISGNTLLINLSEATHNIAKNKVDIYAKYDAVIKEVIVFTGKALVETGDVVKKGDLLVQGAYEDSVAIIGEVAYLSGEQTVRLDISII